MPTPSYAGVVAAAEAVSRVLPPTPAWSYPLLDAEAGVHLIVKHENTQPTGAFKIRGGVNLAATLTEADRAAGLITASTGNHAQSVAYAGRLADTTAVIVAPVGSPPGKLAAVRALGAEVIEHGPTMTEAVEHAERLATERGLRFVSPGNEPAIIHGHATVSIELLRQYPDLQAIYIPAGSGSGAAGACLVRDELAPGCRIIAVQSEAAPAAHDSWRAGRLVTAACETRYSGLATAAAFDLPQAILRERLDDFRLVSEDQIRAAALLLATLAHTLAEGAGAAALAGLLADPDRPERCAVICSGGNADASELADLGR